MVELLERGIVDELHRTRTNLYSLTDERQLAGRVQEIHVGFLSSQASCSEPERTPNMTPFHLAFLLTWKLARKREVFKRLCFLHDK